MARSSAGTGGRRSRHATRGQSQSVPLMAAAVATSHRIRGPSRGKSTAEKNLVVAMGEGTAVSKRKDITARSIIRNITTRTRVVTMVAEEVMEEAEKNRSAVVGAKGLVKNVVNTRRGQLGAEGGKKGSVRIPMAEGVTRVDMGELLKRALVVVQVISAVRRKISEVEEDLAVVNLKTGAEDSGVRMQALVAVSVVVIEVGVEEDMVVKRKASGVSKEVMAVKVGSARGMTKRLEPNA